MKGQNGTHVLQSLVLLLKLGIDLHEALLGLIQIVFNGLDLLLQGAGLLLSLWGEHRIFSKNVIFELEVVAYLLGAKVGVAGLLLALQGTLHRVVLVELHRLHFLLDRVHCGCVLLRGLWKIKI